MVLPPYVSLYVPVLILVLTIDTSCCKKSSMSIMASRTTSVKKWCVTSMYILPEYDLAIALPNTQSALLCQSLRAWVLDLIPRTPCIIFEKL